MAATITTKNHHLSEKIRQQTIRWFTEQNIPLFDDVATGIMNLGEANHDDSVVAAVTLSAHEDDAAKFQLLINHDRFSTYTLEQQSAVVWHELNHILHRHLDMDLNPKQYEMEDEHCRNTAQEIVCNDIILFHNVELPENPVTGPSILGENTFRLGWDTKRVYEELQQSGTYQQRKQQDQNNETATNPDGESLGKQPCKTVADTITQHDVDDATDNVVEGMNNGLLNAVVFEDNDNFGNDADDGGNIANEGALHKIVRVRHQWRGLLRKINPDASKTMSRTFSSGFDTRANWTKRNIWEYGNMREFGARLPIVESTGDFFGAHEKPRPHLIVAVDQSGSIGSGVAVFAKNLALMIPKDSADVQVCVFADKVSEVNLMTGVAENPHIGCGTNFQAVADFVKKHARPNTTILMLTDGRASFRETPHNIHQYFWVGIDVANIEGFRNVLQSHVGLDAHMLRNHVFMGRDISDELR